MLNLLIISNNPKAKLIQKFMQPLIKAKIDLVSDFDHGLKDVFEKRPAMVIIQEQIAGVAGESVARHIQLLLGSGAPTFIMLHEGNARIRPVKGLFDVIVDLDQSDEKLVAEVRSALKGVIGDKWDKVAVPSPKPAPLRVVPANVPDEDRVAADLLADDFLSDLKTSETSLPGQGAGRQVEDAGFRVTSKSDELTSLQINGSQHEPLGTLDADQAPATQPEKQAGDPKRPPKEKPAKPGKIQNSQTSTVTAETGSKSTAAVADSDKEAYDFPVLDAVTPPVPDTPLRTVDMPEARHTVAVTAPRPGTETVVPSPSPADFRISGSPTAYKEQLPEDILMAFDENYRSRSRFWILLLTSVILVSAVAGAWYLYKKKPLSLFFREKLKTSSTAGSPGAEIRVGVKQSAPSPAVLNEVTSPTRPVPAADSPVPSFVTVSGRDNEFSARKPGWERYVDTKRDIRIYRVAGRIKAVQVLAAKGQVITDSFMRTALQELAGSSEYKIRSREQKQGVMIQRCNVGPHSELLVYRKQPSDTISAFVVSFD